MTLPYGIVLRAASAQDMETIGELAVTAYVDGGHLSLDSPYTATLRDVRPRLHESVVLTTTEQTSSWLLWRHFRTVTHLLKRPSLVSGSSGIWRSGEITGGRGWDASWWTRSNDEHGPLVPTRWSCV